MSQRKMSGWTRGKFMQCNCWWGNCRGRNYSGIIVREAKAQGAIVLREVMGATDRGQLSKGVIILEKLSRGKNLGVNCPGGDFIRTNCLVAVIQGKYLPIPSLRNNRDNTFKIKHLAFFKINISKFCRWKKVP